MKRNRIVISAICSSLIILAVGVNDVSGQLSWIFPTGASVYSIDVSDNGQYIAVGSTGNKVYLLNRKGVELWNYSVPIPDGWPHGRKKAVAISADGNYVVAGGTNDRVYVFDKNGTKLWDKNVGSDVKSVGISSDGSRIACGCLNGNIFFFLRESSNPQWSYDVGPEVLTLVISDNGDYIAVGDFYDKVHLLSASGSKIWSYTTPYGRLVTVDISSAGKGVAAGNDSPGYAGCLMAYFSDLYDGTPGWSSTDGSPVWSYHPPGGGSDFLDVAISGDGIYICGGGWGHLAYLYHKDGTRIQTYTGRRSIDLSYDGSYIATGDTEKLFYYSKVDDEPLWEYTTGDDVPSIAVSFYGDFIAAGCVNGNVYAFDLASGAIKGTVSEAKGPIEGAIVDAGGIAYDTTDATGRYIIENLPAGLFNVTASSIWYFSQTEDSVSVTTDDTTTVDFTLQVKPCCGDIDGTVSDGTGPIEGAIVDAEGIVFDTTDATGYYILENLPAGLYDVTASATGYYSQTEDSVSVTVDDTTTASFTLQVKICCGDIDGTVIDGMGPLKDATIDAVWGDSTKSATTDSNGYYIIEALNSGLYNVTASATGYYSQTEDSISVLADDTTTVNFTLNRGLGVIEGTVSEHTKGPIQGAIVEAVGMTTGSDTTDPSGYYIIENLYAGLYSVTASAIDYFPHTQDWVEVLTDDTTTVDFALYQHGMDAFPPEAIDNLTIALENGSKSTAGDMRLWWTEPFDSVGIDRYVVYRSMVPDSLGDSLIGTWDITYLDVGTAGDVDTNYFYTVKAVDAAGHKSDESNWVGEFDLSLTGFKYLSPDEYSLVSWPLLPHDMGIQAVFAEHLGTGCQLTGGSTPGASDLVMYLESTTGTWYTAWYRTGGLCADTLWQGTLISIEPDKGYWIHIRSGHSPVTLTMTGALNWTPRTIPIQPGHSCNYVGTAYAVPCSLGGPSGDDAGLLASGFIGGMTAAFSDKVHYFDGSMWQTAWYKSGGPGWPGWQGTISSLEPGKGYTLEVLAPHAFTNDEWIYPVPPDYSKGSKAVLSEKLAEAPVKREISGAQRDVLSDNPSTSSALETSAKGMETKGSGCPNACFCYGGMDALDNFWYLLDYYGSPLQDGDYVYVAWTGPDGEIDLPAATGDIGAPTDDDSLLTEWYIECGTFFITPSVWSSGAGHPEPGDLIYCRIFDAPKDSLTEANYYGDSQTYTCQYVWSHFYCLFPGDPGGGHTPWSIHHPYPIDDLTIAPSGGASKLAGNIRLLWTSVEGNVAVDHYVVYRGLEPYLLGDSIAAPAETTYLDAGAAGDTLVNFFYAVEVVDSLGRKSEVSSTVGEFDQFLTDTTYTEKSAASTGSTNHYYPVKSAHEASNKSEESGKVGEFDHRQTRED